MIIFIYFRNLAFRAKAVQNEYDQWKEKLKSCNTATDPSFKELENSLRANLKSAEGESRIVSKAVKSIEEKREQFAHVDNKELSDRAAFAKDIKDILKRIKVDLDSEQTKAKKNADINAELNAARAQAMERQRLNNENRMENAVRDERSNKISQLQAQQELLIRDQDVILDSMSDALSRLNNQAHIINDEIENQDILIEDLDGKVDDANNRVEINIQKLERLMKTKSRFKNH